MGPSFTRKLLHNTVIVKIFDQLHTTSLSASDVSYWFVSEPKIAPVRAAPGTLLESVPGDRVYPKYLALKGTSVRSAVEHADWQPQK